VKDVKACCQLDGLVRGSLMNLPPQFASGDLSLSGSFFSVVVVVVVVAAGNCTKNKSLVKTLCFLRCLLATHKNIMKIGVQV